jgi:hypothetical protein
MIACCGEALIDMVPWDDRPDEPGFIRYLAEVAGYLP